MPALCDDCAAGMPVWVGETCGRCPSVVASGPCALCAMAAKTWGGWQFDRARAAFPYSGTLRQAIHHFKYRDARDCGTLLGVLWAQEWLEAGLMENLDCLLAVPGDPFRTRRRGYNPASVLAKPVSDATGLPLLPERSVRRRQSARAQMSCSAEQRRCGANRFGFHVVDPSAVDGKRIGIIDDVFTTGSTVQALALALRESGAASVQVFALCSGH